MIKTTRTSRFGSISISYGSERGNGELSISAHVILELIFVVWRNEFHPRNYVERAEKLCGSKIILCWIIFKSHSTALKIFLDTLLKI